jgi:wyosine [tRNA(Phe)-imidazoG37] synthetase (radical SAM superfamily)
VYCQFGHTQPVVAARRDCVPVPALPDEVREALDEQPSRAVDWITFCGSGEPTLHSGIGAMMREVQTLTAIRVAVITNGALLDWPEARQELSTADAVLPTLCAGTAELFQIIYRPIPRAPSSSCSRG